MDVKKTPHTALQFARLQQQIERIYLPSPTTFFTHEEVAAKLWQWNSHRIKKAAQGAKADSNGGNTGAVTNPQNLGIEMGVLQIALEPGPHGQRRVGLHPNWLANLRDWNEW